MSYELRCPKCDRYMTKVSDAPYLLNDTYFYTCKHCNYISDIMTENNVPFGENYPVISNSTQSISEWNYEKKNKTIAKLKKENVKIINKMYNEYGMITDDDKINLAIWFYEFNKKSVKKKRRKK